MSYEQDAMKAHREGNISAALRLYPKALADSPSAAVSIYLNYGALLRNASRNGEAAAVYRRGLASHSNDVLLQRNYGNLLLSEGHAIKALAQFVEAERGLAASGREEKQEKIRRQQAGALAELGENRLALKLMEPVLELHPGDTGLRLGVAELLLELGESSRAQQVAHPVLTQDLAGLEETFQQCNLMLKLGDPEGAMKKFDDATAAYRRRNKELDQNIRQKFDSTCWNFSLMLLRKGILKRGWELFEHGRRVPNGRGGMQRTVFKQYPARLIHEWDGSPLTGKSILINGEQGIGDVMMFTMLVQSLTKEAQKIGIVTYDRLTQLYKRSFPEITIYDTTDIKSKSINPDDWDFQTPIGSIPMYRFQNQDDYKDLKPFLVAGENLVREFKERYQHEQKQPLIGFSWKGGGNAKQKRTKSLKLLDLLPLFQIEGLRWISLQYGDVKDELERFNKEHDLTLMIADDVDPLTDMDRWSALVKCCDAVISAANTTIHGAGCLGVPTWVILGKEPDWRWISNPGAPCYWYPDVQIVQQMNVGSWLEPIEQLKKSLKTAYSV